MTKKSEYINSLRGYFQDFGGKDKKTKKTSDLKKKIKKRDYESRKFWKTISN